MSITAPAIRPLLERVEQRMLIDRGPPTDVENDRSGAHRGERLRADDPGRLLGQRHRDDDEVRRTPELLQLVERKRAIHERGRGQGTSVGHMDFHFECLGPGGDGLADMPESEQSDRLLRELVVHALGSARPIGPISLTQTAIRVNERYVSLEQRRHHVFGNRLLVPEAIAHDGPIGEQGEVDRVVASPRNVEQLQVRGPRQVVREADTDDRLGLRVRTSIVIAAQHVGQDGDPIRSIDKPLKVMAEGRGVLAVEHDAHDVAIREGARAGGRIARQRCCLTPRNRRSTSPLRSPSEVPDRSFR